MAEIVIVGAGLTGLSTAYHLEKQGFYDYQIVEANDRPGGLLQSVTSNGFTFDYTGHLLHISDPYFKFFLEAVVGLTNLNFIQRKTGIFSHNVITHYPFQMNLYGLPLDVATECIEGYVQRATNIRNPQTFYQWVLKYFGAGFGKHFFFPYNQKQLAYDLRRVHATQTGRFAPSTNLQAIIKGTIDPNPAGNVGYNASFYYPKAEGIELLIKKILATLRNQPHNNHRVVHIDTTHKRLFFDNGTQQSYRHLITTMPLQNLLHNLSYSTRTPWKLLSCKLLHNSVININLGFKADPVIPMHWMYFPEKLFSFYRLGFWHNLSATSVPKNCTAIYGEVAYRSNNQSKDSINQLTEQAIEQITRFLKLPSSAIINRTILPIPTAYVIYDRWRQHNLARLLTHLEELNIHSIGRYGAWKYASMQEAVLDGKETALHVLENIHHNGRMIIPATIMQQPNKKVRLKEESA